MGRDYDLNSKIYEKLEGFELENIAEFQATYLASKKYYYCVVGSEERIDKKDLKKLGKLKVLSLDDIFGE